MTITRADAESILVKRVGPLLAVAGMDGSTVDGSNDDLNDPIGRSVRDLGYTVTSITSITDADVAQVTDAQIDQFLDVAELRALQSILGNYDDVDLRIGARTEKLSQTVEQIENRIEGLEKRLASDYGWGLSAPSALVITADFAQHGDDE